jgi:serine phosphatase RsbU (regulator of sigma subunit)
LLLVTLVFVAGILRLDLAVQLGPLGIQPWTVVMASMAHVGSAILVRRTWKQWRSSERLHGEITAAQEVQSALMLVRAAGIPGFDVDAVYLPAEEVGGDFYHVLPCGEASSVIVIGDVSGKGLKAAMVASIVAGAVEVASESGRPADILTRINRVLTGRLDGGFVTCCCLRLDVNGSYTVANAGHIAPYIGGQPTLAQPGLPLGVVADAVWDEATGVLEPGEEVVLVFDGVVEARGPKGELYGFERVEAEIAQFRGAAELAQKARDFGQDDDITILAITRREAGAHAA